MMKKILFILSLLISFNCYSQIVYLVQRPGVYIAYGVSDSTKPVNPPNNCLYVEINTGKYYFSSGGSWNQVTTGTDTTSLSNRINAKLSTAAAALTYQPVGTYLLANGSAALLTNFPTLNQNTTGTASNVTNPVSFANGGISAAAATSATTGTMTVNMTSPVITITPTGACTFNASGGVAGQIVTFSITTSGVSSFVLTFGTNFRKVGTLATGTTSARFFAVTFICINGTIWQEISRTAVQT